MPTTLTLDDGDLAKDAVIEECTLASLEARVRAISSYHIGRVLRHLVVSAFRPAPLSQHAIVPFGFRRQVGWVTQKSVLRTSPLSERDRTTGEMAHVVRIAYISIHLDALPSHLARRFAGLDGVRTERRVRCQKLFHAVKGDVRQQRTDHAPHNGAKSPDPGCQQRDRD